MKKTPAEIFQEQVRWSIPCCPNCCYFSTGTAIDLGAVVDSPERLVEYCTLDPQRRTPPAKVIAFGCPHFMIDIPF